MQSGEELATLLVIIGIIALAMYRRKWRGSGTAYGTAEWATRQILLAAGMLGRHGLILGRTLGGEVLRIPRYTHCLLIGGTGAGKGVSIIIPQLLTYLHGSCVCFDTKGDLFATTAAVRRRMGRVIRLAPFNGGRDRLNPLDFIRPGKLLIDSARALAEAIVVRQGTEPDPHWNESAVMVITALLVLVLTQFDGEERSLNSVREIASDPALLDAAAAKLVSMGGIPARLGNHVKGLMEKERAGVMSTVARHLAFLDSELVAAAVASSTFDTADLRRPGTTVFMQIPPELVLEAQRGLLRVWVSTLVRAIGQGSETDGEVLFLLDEASALGANLPALEEALVRGRSGGARLLLAFQSDSQVTAAFKDKPTLIYDNSSVQVYVGAPSSYEAAEQLAKRIGDATIVLESGGESRSWQQGGHCENGGTQVSRNRNWQELGRPLMRPEEILLMSSELLIAFVKDVPPILARRIKWFADPLFGTAKEPKRKRMRRLGWVLLAIGTALCVAILRSRQP